MTNRDSSYSNQPSHSYCKKIFKYRCWIRCTFLILGRYKRFLYTFQDKKKHIYFFVWFCKKKHMYLVATYYNATHLNTLCFGSTAPELHNVFSRLFFLVHDNIRHTALLSRSIVTGGTWINFF